MPPKFFPLFPVLAFGRRKEIFFTPNFKKAEGGFPGELILGGMRM